MNNEQQQIINEAYGNFIKSYTGKDNEIILPSLDYINDDGNLMSKNQFITNIKYDYWFSEKWGLKIDERELRYEERIKLYEEKTNLSTTYILSVKETLDSSKIPTKLITITYKEQTIESYE
jgi:hypothetical protein